MNTDTAMVLLLTDRQRELEMLRGQVRDLAAERDQLVNRLIAATPAPAPEDQADYEKGEPTLPVIPTEPPGEEPPSDEGGNPLGKSSQ